jgi:hypothetical protein
MFLLTRDGYDWLWPPPLEGEAGVLTTACVLDLPGPQAKTDRQATLVLSGGMSCPHSQILN